ncbi:MAG: DUF2075 domain-containing protein [Gemmatimonadota bacterium]
MNDAPTKANETPLRARSSAYLGMPVAEFRSRSSDELLGKLTKSSDFDVDLSQRGAWEGEIEILTAALDGIEGYLYLEFDVPRLGTRIDAVLISGPVIFPIEFKVGERQYSRDDVNQAWDYGLDLKNFHRASHDAPILPILVATGARKSESDWAPPHADGVRPPRCCNATDLGSVIREGLAQTSGTPIDGEGWGRAPYHPTPTIIEAAQALYARHSVEAISRNDAGARNLAITSKRVEEVIEEARQKQQKAIVFVTGVPGAGKTLVGLNVATQKRDETSPTHAVFLSGNGPLVAVLREALIRDEVARTKARGESVRKGVVAQKVKPFIQNVHHFRDDGLRDEALPPLDHVVIFDEAQRAWNQAKTSDFMRRRKNRPNFDQSEPQFLIGYMDRHADWSVIICLVGGGQEIHTGEAGIGAWLDAVREHYPHWSVYLSPKLSESEYAAVESIQALSVGSEVRPEPDLHLATSMRSFRSERVSEFVKAVLDCDTDAARELLREVTRKYPIVLTRDLTKAKAWIRAQARGTERYGLVASSQAERLKPHAIDVRVNVDPVQWFLNDAADTRSSWYLEDAATEFQIQGLELDWICVNWDADLRYTESGWSHHRFRGSSWVQVRKDDARQYLVNAYRVLLTRARQGMVIFVPPGDEGDPTRAPGYYDQTYRYLAALGVATTD